MSNFFGRNGRSGLGAKRKPGKAHPWNKAARAGYQQQHTGRHGDADRFSSLDRDVLDTAIHYGRDGYGDIPGAARGLSNRNRFCESEE